MSSAPTPSSTGLTPTGAAKREITLISHSMLFYWWPIWVVGLIMFAVTYFENHRLAIVPDGSKLSDITTEQEKGQNITAYRLAIPNPPTRSLEHAENVTKNPAPGETTFQTLLEVCRGLVGDDEKVIGRAQGDDRPDRHGIVFPRKDVSDFRLALIVHRAPTFVCVHQLPLLAH